MTLLAGCAGGTAPTRGSTLNLAAPCLPSGISEEFFFWPVVAHRSVTLRTDTGGTADGIWVVYARGEHAVAVIWAGERLLAVDPSPETDDPDWVDAGLVTADDDGLMLRTNPGAPCAWQRNVTGVSV